MPSYPTSTPKKNTKTELPMDDSGMCVRLTDITGITEDGADEGKGASITPTSSKSSDITVNMDKLDEVEEEDFEEEEGSSILSSVGECCGDKLKWIVLAVLAVLYLFYFGYSLYVAAVGRCGDDHDVVPLVVITVLVLAGLLVSYVQDKFGEDIRRAVAEPCSKAIDRHWHCLKWVLAVLPVLGIVVIIISSAAHRPSNLMSLIGWLFLLCLLVLCSKAPRKIRWRPVVGGFALQFYFAALILKSDAGYNMFEAMGTGFTKFLKYSEDGAKFVFGSIDDHFFAFGVLPVIIFFSCVITTLYHLRIMQAIIGKIAFVMRITLGTTAAESLCAAGNIFVGQTEAPIMIRPFLSMMTRSELHAVMVGGFGTIAGAVLAAYIMKGVPATHLLTACVMNAPTALAVSKVLYPELSKSKISKMKEAIGEKKKIIELANSNYNNFIEAAAAGASAAISLVANVAANLIAFVALLHFANAAISWIGSFVCYSELSFEAICSVVLMPLAYLMGVEWRDAGVVAGLLGKKTFLNEFLAYDDLSKFIKARTECIPDAVTLSVRSETIATYALCGFANLSSIGIQLGGLGPMAPGRLGDLAQLAVTALVGGIVTNLMTACVAGLLVIEYNDVTDCFTNATTAVLNSTLGDYGVLNATTSPVI